MSSIYPFSFSLLAPCMAMTERGLRVNDALRQERLVALSAAAAEQRDSVQPIIERVRDRLQAINLYWKSKVCRGCRNGKRKRIDCAACVGVGKFTEFVFN